MRIMTKIQQFLKDEMRELFSSILGAIPKVVTVCKVALSVLLMRKCSY